METTKTAIIKEKNWIPVYSKGNKWYYENSHKELDFIDYTKVQLQLLDNMNKELYKQNIFDPNQNLILSRGIEYIENALKQFNVIEIKTK